MAIKLSLNFIYIKVLGIADLRLRLSIIQVNLSSALALHANYIFAAAARHNPSKLGFCSRLARKLR